LTALKILGVETSCDETSAAVVQDGGRILSNVVSSQIDLHRPYGGVVPELASRRHLELIDTVVAQALESANTTFDGIDAVAGTYGPGLATSLLVGLTAAKGMALALGKPFVGINHIEAHLYSPLLVEAGEDALPMVSLIVSGGHTILAYATGIGRHEVLGQTVDDAAGEAFDKVAKLLGLGYPGGPEIDKRARQGNPEAVKFPRSMLDDGTYNFSFSGLKTSVLYWLRKHPAACVDDVCASFQEAVVDVLTGKLVRVAVDKGVRTVSASGGVSINSRFREKLGIECRRLGLRLLLAPAALCTDNAGMIAALAFYKLSETGRSEFGLEAAPSIGLHGVPS
jgi:N6-L-threonylcarbamoyladenine synthase